MSETRKTVHLLDYVAGNIRSLVNAIEKCGYEVEWIQSPEDVAKAEVSLGSFQVYLLFCVMVSWVSELEMSKGHIP